MGQELSWGGNYRTDLTNETYARSPTLPKARPLLPVYTRLPIRPPPQHRSHAGTGSKRSEAMLSPLAPDMTPSQMKQFMQLLAPNQFVIPFHDDYSTANLTPD